MSLPFEQDSSRLRAGADGLSQRQYNHLLSFGGGLVTAAVTSILFLLPALVPFDTMRQSIFELTGWWMTENPLVQLRFLGGIPGAFLVGYAVKDEFGKNEWGVGLKYAILAVMTGVILFYAAYIVAITLLGTIGTGPTPTVMYLFVVSPLVLVLPLFTCYLIEGFLVGLAGVAVSRWRS